MRWSPVITLAQVALLVVTFFVPGFGAPLWSHLVSLALVLVLVPIARRALASRRVLAIGALVTSILAIVSGFYLLYWKEGIRADGYQDWGVWWHVAWSWAAAVFFWQHTWINRIQFVHFFRRTFAQAGAASLHLGLYVLTIVAVVVSWTVGKGWFSGGNYIAWTLATWLAVTVPAYVVWWSGRTRRGHEAAWTWRRGVDLALVPAAALATLSGIPLTFFDDWTDAMGLKYASKYWHVAASVVFTVLVFAHSVQVWRTVTRHWQALRGEPAQ